MRRRPRHRAACTLEAFMLSVSALGCSLPAVPLEGRPCPCGVGWRCNAVSLCERCPEGRCESIDSGLDAYALDAFAVDAARDAHFLDDAPDPDSGSPDAFVPPDAWVASRCDLGREAIWCSGFERGASDFGPPSVGVAGEVMFSNEFVVRGSQSGRVSSRTSATFENYLFRRDGLVLPNSGHMYLTFWMRIEATDAAATAAWYFAAIGNPSFDHRVILALDPRRSSQLTVLLGQPQENVGANFQQGFFQSDSSIALREWTCIELDVTLATPGDIDVHYTRRGGPRTRLGDVAWRRLGKEPPPVPVTISPSAFTDVSLGLDYETRAHTLFFDDVSIGRTPQPCD